MTREEQYIEAAKPYADEPLRYLGFMDGAEWADEHPSEQTLTKTVCLYKRWLVNQSELNLMEFIKKNWNIEL